MKFFKSLLVILIVSNAYLSAGNDSHVVPLNQQNFNESISEGYVLVDFWASWCRPCLIQKPILEEVAEELEGQIVIASVNTEKNALLTQQFGIRSIPAMILFKDGEEVKRLLGLHQKGRLMRELQNYLQ